MKVRDIEAIVVQRPSMQLDAADAMQDALIVRIETDEGIVGYGEGNHTPRAMKAIIDSQGSHSWSRGIEDLLVGQDALHPERMWDRLLPRDGDVGPPRNDGRGPRRDRCCPLGHQR